ncbi:MAG: prepilin-type N-terminal cleavage/methylation domain-containing protein [bacterium]
MRKGFTLLELLIVVVILGVLALIAAPTLMNAADQAKTAAVKANVSAAASSVTSRFATNTTEDADAVLLAVFAKLNDGNNTNPVTGTGNPFAAAAAAGVVTLVAGNDADGTEIVTITGYDKNSTAVLTKIVAAPSDNT